MTVGAAALLALSLCAGLVYLRAIWDPVDALPGSLAFRLGIPDDIKALPLASPCAPPRYSFQGPDGAKPSLSSVTYATTVTPPDVLAPFRRLLAERQCRIGESGNVTWGEDCTGGELRLELDPAPGSDGCRRVSMTVLGGSP